MPRRIRIHEYHPSNPKIDLYWKGKYLYSTNWFTRVRDARDWHINNHMTSEETLQVCSLPRLLRAVKDTRR